MTDDPITMLQSLTRAAAWFDYKGTKTAQKELRQAARPILAKLLGRKPTKQEVEAATTLGWEATR